MIETAPQRPAEVPGLGPKRTSLITQAWAEQKAIKEVMVFLQGVGVSTSLAVRIYKQYADASIGVVRNEPYRLASEVWGIGFKTADTIARAVGIPADSPQRIKAGLQFTLSEATGDGHCFLPEQELIAQAIKILQVDTGLVIDALAELVAEEGVLREQLPGGDAEQPTWRSTWWRCSAPRFPWPASCGRCCTPVRTGCRASPQLAGRCQPGRPE